MNAAQRIFMDVSYTRTQHASVGITRTVRRLAEELRQLSAAEGRSFAAVSFHTDGFRQLATDGLASSLSRGVSNANDKPAARLFRWITGAFFRKIVLAALLLPWSLVRGIWAATSAMTFNFISRSEPAVVFQNGDVLLLCDASWNYPVWIAASKARAQGARVVFLMYDLIPLRHPEFCFALVPRVFRLWLDRMLPIADAVVSISEATQTDLRHYVNQAGVVIPPSGYFRLGSDPLRAGLAVDHVRSELSAFVSAPVPCFAAIGSFEPKKNYGFLLDVFESMWARGLQLRLLIIGRESAESQDLIQRVRRHPQQGGLLLTLFDAGDAEVALAYAQCRALVFPSLAEGFGLPLVEARTRGSLVIASSLPCFVELADAGVSIYPENSHRALEQLIVEHAETDRRSRIAPMQPFTWKDSATQLMAISEGLLYRGHAR